MVIRIIENPGKWTTGVWPPLFYWQKPIKEGGPSIVSLDKR